MSKTDIQFGRDWAPVGSPTAEVLSAIYALIDPRTNSVRYIGKTFRPRVRLSGHINSPCNVGMRRWLNDMKQCGIIPSIFIIEWCADWKDAERFWIAEFQKRDATILNVRQGGNEGVYTSDVAAKISASKRGKTFTAEHRAKLRAAKIGTRLSGAHRIRIGEANIGRSHSAETRAKLKAAHIGKKMSPESIAKMVAHRLGKKHSPEHIEKIRMALIGRKTGPLSGEHKEKLRIANLGKVIPKETREKIRQTMLVKKRKARVEAHG